MGTTYPSVDLTHVPLVHLPIYEPMYGRNYFGTDLGSGVDISILLNTPEQRLIIVPTRSIVVRSTVVSVTVHGRRSLLPLMGQMISTGGSRSQQSMRTTKAPHRFIYESPRHALVCGTIKCQVETPCTKLFTQTSHARGAAVLGGGTWPCQSSKKGRPLNSVDTRYSLAGACSNQTVAD